MKRESSLGFVAANVGVLIGLTVGCAPSPATSDQRPAGKGPMFAVRFGSGAFVEYNDSASTEKLDASLRDLEDGYWQLTVRVKNETIKELWFPWERGSNPLGASAEDDVLYFPHWMGQARLADRAPRDKWEGRSYPGQCFTPLAVIADETRARIVAAANWPPVKVFVAYSQSRLGLRYDDFAKPGEQRTLTAWVAEANGQAAVGNHPWYSLLDRYKRFLNTNMQFEGLHPIAYPSWLRMIHGWQNVQLQNLKDHELNRVAENWDRFKGVFPWLQMWGQMSDAFPTPGKETGCCMERSALHERYRSPLPPLLARVAREGHWGFYCRPRSPYGSLTANTATSGADRGFLLEWVQRNRSEYGANAFYIDVLGAEYFGDALAVARMFGRELPMDSVVEMPMDVYPTAFLISGCLWGGSSCSTNPGQSCDDLQRRAECVSFPAFGRYLLSDRIFFLGESNGDHAWWGTARGHEYWTERQAFLLGAKLDAMRIAESDKTPDVLNRAVEMIVAERDRVGWWDREPEYLDRSGVYDVPPGVDVRRFRGRKGENLLVVDNWKRREGSFRFLGRAMPVPRQALAILVDP